MRLKTGYPQQDAGPGFTLIELLLATALTLMLVAAAVFSFTSLQHGAALSQGAQQFEALIRYARAHAANTGRQVVISFEDGADPDFPWIPADVAVDWEPDPLGQPGMFKRLPSAEPYLAELNRLVQVEDVRVSDPEGGAPAALEAASSSDEDAFVADDPTALPSIRIYPDGSSDSAEVILVAREEGKGDRLSVSLVGLTGAIRQHPYLDPLDAAAAENEPPLDPDPVSESPAEAVLPPGNRSLAPTGRTDAPETAPAGLPGTPGTSTSDSEEF